MKSSKCRCPGHCTIHVGANTILSPHYVCNFIARCEPYARNALTSLSRLVRTFVIISSFGLQTLAAALGIRLVVAVFFLPIQWNQTYEIHTFQIAGSNCCNILENLFLIASPGCV